MSKHISKRFDQDLENLQQMIIKMGKLTQSECVIIHDYLRGNSPSETLKKIDHFESQIDQLHLDINTECVRLTATRAPVAVDLRFLSVAVRISIDFERIGDELRKITRFLLQEDMNVSSELWQSVCSTARLAYQMLSSALTVIETMNANEAMKLLREDHELNANFVSVTRQLITFMMEDPRNIGQAVDVLFAAKALERVGDHSINIAEAVIFYEKAQDLRHKSADEIDKWVNENK